MFLTFIASESLKLSYTLNYVIKRANDLKNSYKLTRFAFEVRNLGPFRVRVNRNRFRTRQAHSRDIINILLTSSSWSVL